MITTIVTATEMQNNFEMYLNLIMLGQEVIVTVNGKEIGRFVPKDAVDSYLTDSLTGILKGGYDLNEEKTKRAEQKKTNLERFAELPVELQDKLLAVVETMNSLK